MGGDSPARLTGTSAKSGECSKEKEALAGTELKGSTTPSAREQFRDKQTMASDNPGIAKASDPLKIIVVYCGTRSQAITANVATKESVASSEDRLLAILGKENTESLRTSKSSLSDIDIAELPNALEQIKTSDAVLVDTLCIDDAFVREFLLSDAFLQYGTALIFFSKEEDKKAEEKLFSSIACDLLLLNERSPGSILRSIRFAVKRAKTILYQKNFLNRVIDVSPNFVFAKDRDGKFIVVNQAIADAFGTTVENILGKTDADFNPNQEEVKHFRKDDLEVMDSQQEKFILEEKITDADGNLRWLQTVKRPMVGSDGIANHVLGVATDITKRKEIEIALRKSEEALQQKNKLESLGLFAGGIAHDFNNLLASVLGHVHLARTELGENKEVRTRLDSIELVLQQSSELTNELLTYAGRGDLRVQSTDLSKLVAEMTQLLNNFVDHTVVLETELSDTLPPVSVDSSQIRRVLLNLVINAAEALEGRSGKIVIRTRAVKVGESALSEFSEMPDGAYACLEVADTGKGMSEVTRKKIFDPFYSTKSTGKGLGLASVIGIVRGHDGTIHVESELEQGATFKVLLPVTPHAESSATIQDIRAPKDGISTILLAEDDPAVREVTRLSLEKSGFNVLVAEDGLAAVEVFKQRSRDVHAVLIDSSMPRMDGPTACKKIRSMSKNTPIIVSSGLRDQITMLVDGEEDKNMSFIQKPYSPVELIKRLKGVIR